MNIIYMNTHDTGRYLEPYGYAIPTPNLMELAEEATTFQQCHCACPTCSPSRAALLTGTWPHVNGMMGLAHRGFRINDYRMHLSHYLAEQGYETAISGIQHESVSLDALGYQKILYDFSQMQVNTEYVGEKDLQSAKAAADYLYSRAGKNGNFFLAVGLQNCHRPYPDYEGYVRPDFVQPPGVIYNCRETREDMAGFLRSAQIADECVGIVYRAMKDAGLEDNTIFLFTTDHGIAFPHMKCNLYDTGTGVAFMMRYPQNPSAGTSSDALISQVDVFPTLCELCGLPIPEWVDGTSFASVFLEKEAPGNDYVFSEVTYHAAYEPMRSVRSNRYKLIRRFDDYLGQVPANIDDGGSKQFLLKHGFLDSRHVREELYDLYLDPLERCNRIGDMQYLSVYHELLAELNRWMEETGDQLWQNRVNAPQGARINKRSCIECTEQDYE